MWRWSLWYDTGLSSHEPSPVPYPGYSLSQFFPSLSVIYHMLDWKWLSQPPPYQPWLSPLKVLWFPQWHSHETWRHNIWGMTTTQGNHILCAENLEGQIYRVIYIDNKIGKTQATFLTFIFLIPGTNNLTTFPQTSSSMYYSLFEFTQNISGNPYLVTKLVPLSLWCTK